MVVSFANIGSRGEPIGIISPMKSNVADCGGHVGGRFDRAMEQRLIDIADTDAKLAKQV